MALASRAARQLDTRRVRVRAVEVVARRRAAGRAGAARPAVGQALRAGRDVEAVGRRRARAADPTAQVVRSILEVVARPEQVAIVDRRREHLAHVRDARRRHAEELLGHRRRDAEHRCHRRLVDARARSLVARAHHRAPRARRVDDAQLLGAAVALRARRVERGAVRRPRAAARERPRAGEGLDHVPLIGRQPIVGGRRDARLARLDGLTGRAARVHRVEPRRRRRASACVDVSAGVVAVHAAVLAAGTPAVLTDTIARVGRRAVLRRRSTAASSEQPPAANPASSTATAGTVTPRHAALPLRMRPR